MIFVPQVSQFPFMTSSQAKGYNPFDSSSDEVRPIVTLG
jgi:hypothetical protein